VKGRGPTFEDIFAVMATASIGDPTARVRLPADPDLDDLATRFALALNVLLDDLAAKTRESNARAEAIASAEARREADATFRALLEAAPDAMVVVGPDGGILLVNAQTERTFGRTRAELLGQPVGRVIPTPHGDPAGRATELVGVRSDGSEFPIEVTSSPLDTREGRWVLHAIRDISERKRTEAALTVANRELESFSYSVAHDLRAPLRAMNGFAHILLDEHADGLDAGGRECLDRIRHNALQMAQLIDALLSLARTTRMELAPSWIDLTEVARASVGQLAATDRDRRVQLVVGAPVLAYVDPQLGRNLLDNLIGNAWKFTSKVPDATIEFGCVEGLGGPTCFVRDNGAGFDMAYAHRLFGPFQRLHTVREFHGTGIGLATAQRIVQRHGGRIWAEGRVDGGATFYFTLPFRSAGDPVP
jgi:PAS domain S-box-containing protein